MFDCLDTIKDELPLLRDRRDKGNEAT